MAEATETVETIKTASDGTVKISVEKYNELVETVASQKGSINSLRSQLNQARNEPPVINRTIVEKTPELLAREQVAWGATFMGGGASLFVIGALMFRAGRAKS
jgi:hypothetical protein